MFFCENCNSVSNIQKKIKTNMSPEIMDKFEGQSDFFFCFFCGYVKKIEDNTKIFSRNKRQTQYISPDKIIMDLYPKRSNYICQNKNCESHNQKNKTMTIFKNENSEIIYICDSCKLTQEHVITDETV